MTEFKNFFKQNNSVYRFQEKIASVCGEKYVLFLTGSYGDIFPNFTLLKSFVDAYGEKPVIICNQRYEELAKRFVAYIERVVFLGNDFDLRKLLQEQVKVYSLEKGAIYPTLPTMYPLLPEAVLSDRIGDYEMKRLILGLPVGEKVFIPEFSSQRKLFIEGEFLKTGCRPGKTIIISPESNTNQAPTFDFWVSLLKMAEERDFDIVINNASSFRVDNHGYDALKKPVIKIFPDCPCEIVDLAGFHVSGTNGLAAVLATHPSTNLKVAAVTPIPENGFFMNNGMRLSPNSKGLSIKNGSCPEYMYDVNRYYEELYMVNNSERVINNVLAFFMNSQS